MNSTTMITRSRRQLDLLNPDPAQIHLPDIAHALGALCRYNGHTPQHYSVAEHSVWVAYAVAPELRLHALLHDAHEAYLGDWPSPVKGCLEDAACNARDDLERWFDETIYEAVGLECPTIIDPNASPRPNPLWDAIRAADLAVGAAECEAFGFPVSPGREQRPWDWQAAGFEAFPLFQSREDAAAAWLKEVEQALSQHAKETL